MIYSLIINTEARLHIFTTLPKSWMMFVLSVKQRNRSQDRENPLSVKVEFLKGERMRKVAMNTTDQVEPCKESHGRFTAKLLSYNNFWVSDFTPVSSYM